MKINNPSYLTKENNPATTKDPKIILVFLLRNNVNVQTPRNKNSGSFPPKIELSIILG